MFATLVFIHKGGVLTDLCYFAAYLSTGKCPWLWSLFVGEGEGAGAEREYDFGLYLWDVYL